MEKQTTTLDIIMTAKWERNSYNFRTSNGWYFISPSVHLRESLCLIDVINSTSVFFSMANEIHPYCP